MREKIASSLQVLCRWVGAHIPVVGSGNELLLVPPLRLQCCASYPLELAVFDASEDWKIPSDWLAKAVEKGLRIPVPMLKQATVLQKHLLWVLSVAAGHFVRFLILWARRNANSWCSCVVARKGYLSSRQDSRILCISC